MYSEHIAKIAKMTVDQIISIGKRQLSYRNNNPTDHKQKAVSYDIITYLHCFLLIKILSTILDSVPVPQMMKNFISALIHTMCAPTYRTCKGLV